MESFQSLKLDGSRKLQLFDKNWNLLQTIDIAGKIPLLSKGKNTVVFDAEFSGEGTSMFKIELKTIG